MREDPDTKRVLLALHEAEGTVSWDELKEELEDPHGIDLAPTINDLMNRTLVFEPELGEFALNRWGRSYAEERLEALRRVRRDGVES